MDKKPPIGDALRLLRIRKGLTQTAASKFPGSPDFRTLSHWETRRKMPSLTLLMGYLAALDLDLHDLQDALDQVLGSSSPMSERFGELVEQVNRLAHVVEDLGDRRQVVLEQRLLALESANGTAPGDALAMAGEGAT